MVKGTPSYLGQPGKYLRILFKLCQEMKGIAKKKLRTLLDWPRVFGRQLTPFSSIGTLYIATLSLLYYPRALHWQL